MTNLSSFRVIPNIDYSVIFFGIGFGVGEVFKVIPIGLVGHFMAGPFIPIPFPPFITL